MRFELNHPGQHWAGHFNICHLSLHAGSHNVGENNFLIGTLSKPRLQGSELRLQQHFRWVMLRWDQEPLHGLLGRHLRRKLLLKVGQRSDSSCLWFESMKAGSLVVMLLLNLCRDVPAGDWSLVGGWPHGALRVVGESGLAAAQCLPVPPGHPRGSARAAALPVLPCGSQQRSGCCQVSIWIKVPPTVVLTVSCLLSV